MFFFWSLRPLNANREPSLYSETPAAVRAKIATALHHGMQNPLLTPGNLDIQHCTVVRTHWPVTEAKWGQFYANHSVNGEDAKYSLLSLKELSHNFHSCKGKDKCQVQEMYKPQLYMVVQSNGRNRKRYTPASNRLYFQIPISPKHFMCVMLMLEGIDDDLRKCLALLCEHNSDTIRLGASSACWSWGHSMALCAFLLAEFGQGDGQGTWRLKY